MDILEAVAPDTSESDESSTVDLAKPLLPQLNMTED